MERENIEWTQHYWFDVANGSEHLPRVMLIGDSIVALTRENTAKYLKGKATVVGFSTSKIIGDPAYFRELELAMADYPVDLIVLNNGLHGLTDTFGDDYYEGALRQLLEFLRLNSRARIMWRASTPVTAEHDEKTLHLKLNPIVIRRNAIAARVMAECDIPVIDMYTPLLKHPEFRAWDGFHYLPEGCDFIGKAVAKAIADYLKARKLTFKIGGKVTDYPGQQSNWNGYERLDFSVDGVHCVMVKPNCAIAPKHFFFLEKASGTLSVKSRDLLRNGWLALYCSQNARKDICDFVANFI